MNYFVLCIWCKKSVASGASIVIWRLRGKSKSWLIRLLGGGLELLVVYSARGGGGDMEMNG